MFLFFKPNFPVILVKEVFIRYHLVVLYKLRSVVTAKLTRELNSSSDMADSKNSESVPIKTLSLTVSLSNNIL